MPIAPPEHTLERVAEDAEEVVKLDEENTSCYVASVFFTPLQPAAGVEARHHKYFQEAEGAVTQFPRVQS